MPRLAPQGFPFARPCWLDLRAEPFTMTPMDSLQRLEATIKARRAAGAADSYVATLSAKGRAKIVQKLGEEAVETVIAAIQDDRAGVIGEGADLLFHLAVLLADMGLSFADLAAELDRREGLSGLAEKASRPKD